MKKLFFLLILCSMLSFESESYSDLTAIDSTINLKWNKAYSDDTIDKSLIGLKWALSYMGAILPSSAHGFSIDTNIITIDLQKLGFNENAQGELLKLSEKIKKTSEYKVNNSIDLGRFVTLLLGSSEHYYQIIGTPKKLNEILSRYTLSAKKGYVNKSTVSKKHRVIRFSEQKDFNQLFISEEVDPVSGEVLEYETIELLENGQLRFGIFDTEGNRKNNGDDSHSAAGKPAKCMWCHESNVSQMFSVQDDFPDYLSNADFQKTLLAYRESNTNQKLKLTDGVDFAQTQQHTLTELLYISFMEPSAERLSLEWNLPIATVQEMLAGLPTHTYDEFPFLGKLYHRKEIENLAPFNGLSVSGNVREASETEVNHLID